MAHVQLVVLQLGRLQYCTQRPTLWPTPPRSLRLLIPPRSPQSTHFSSLLQKSLFPQPLLQSSLFPQPLHLSRVSALAVHFRLRHLSYRQLLLSCHRPICSNELLNKLIHVDDFQPSQEPAAFNKTIYKITVKQSETVCAESDLSFGFDNRSVQVQALLKKHFVPTRNTVKAGGKFAIGG
jgi:hypothetical protein